MGLLPFEQVTRKVVVKRESVTSNKYGKRPSERTIKELFAFGVIPLDKPSGPTSHQVSAYVQNILKLERAGHSGTLDPKVTGVLPVATLGGTRVANSLLTAGKEYVTLIHFHKPVEEYHVRKLLSEFQGLISQLPPIKSAVKRRVRERMIYYLEFLEMRGQDVLFVAGTQAGTYIRKLCHDMGQALKNAEGKPVGAHMGELRRTKAGPFNEGKGLVTLHDLADAFHYWREEGDESKLRACLLPAEEGLSHLPKIWVLDSAVDSLCNGVQLKVPGIARLHDDIKPGESVAILTLKGEAVLVGKARLTSKEMLGDKGVAVRTEQVFMRPGTYPRQQA